MQEPHKFCPESAPPSGPVQRVVLYAAFGGITAYGSENLHNRAGARWKCTPFVACGDVSPGGGDFSDAIL